MGTVKTLIHRARATLAGALEHQEGKQRNGL
jgi:DNA-directed RNA polymerase specialized sigma24 family protein